MISRVAFDDCQFDSVCFASPLAQGERTEVRGFRTSIHQLPAETLTFPLSLQGRGDPGAAICSTYCTSESAVAEHCVIFPGH
jgi:hypothetical protein